MIGYHIETELKIYLFLWVSAVFISCYFMIRHKKNYEILNKKYWTFLLEPWKLATFIFATFLITIAAPYSGDPTWDIPDSIIISIVTYILAPWSIATIYRSIRDKKIGSKLFVALSAFFIPCWVYDLYVLLRDEIYPPTWYHNLYLSGPIVLLAGLFWNLLWIEKKGVTFAFTNEAWPTKERTPFKKIFWVCFLLGIPVAASIAWFVVTYLFE